MKNHLKRATLSIVVLWLWAAQMWAAAGAPPTPTPTASPLPPTLTPTPDAAQAETLPPADNAYLAVLITEAVVTVGGTAESEVFVAARGLDAPAARAELYLRFDSTIVGGTSGEAGTPKTEGTILLAISDEPLALAWQQTGWTKVATLTWSGRREGKSLVTVAEETRFWTADGTARAPDAAYNGVVFSRVPGTIQGQVRLQGRTDCRGVTISGALSATYVDRGETGADGRFAVRTSFGEGFYTLSAHAPGYLSAASAPVKMTVGSVIDVGEVLLYGGDVNGDNQIDIRDITYVAWHFSDSDPLADLNGDGEVDILDLSLTAANYGRSGPTPWETSGDE